MKKLFSSFYARLSMIFLILLLVMGSIYIAISVRSSIGFVEEADQRMNANLASSIALEVKPYVKDSIETDQINQLLHYLMVINPHIEIYLLDSTGTILAFFADQAKKIKRDKVSLQPIREFIASDQVALVKGDDPRNVDRLKPFSASAIRLKDNSLGYIYVILGGEQYDLASGAIKEQFLTSTIARGLVLALLFTAILGLVLFFLMTKRLRVVTNVVSGFKDGNYDRRLEDNSQDDFGRLSRAFNQMADTIVKNMDELKRSDDLRRELVANVSHDLRTPLASLQGYLETILMKQDKLSPDEIERYMKISLRNARYLNQLVSELFELSKLNAIHAKPHKESFSISELIQDIIYKFKSSADAKQIDISCPHKEGIPLVMGDIGMIERAVSNLLENAIRYASEKGRITVELIPGGGSVRVEVSDSGPGIADEDVPYIFLPYYRSKRTPPRETPGTGLGLAITKRIIELHDSDIHVASELDKGTTFYFDLACA
jgi:signal transduction histidine kinase